MLLICYQQPLLHQEVEAEAKVEAAAKVEVTVKVQKVKARKVAKERVEVFMIRS